MSRKREFILHEYEEIIAYTNVIGDHILVQVGQGELIAGKFKAAEKQGFENYKIEGADYKEIVDEAGIVIETEDLWDYIDKAREEYLKGRENDSVSE